MFDKTIELPKLRASASRPIFAIWEGNYLLHRAAATQPSVVTEDGIEVGAVHGLLRMLSSDLRLLRPKYVAVSFDVPGLNFRHRISEDYKLADANDPGNQSLARQITIAVRLLRLLGMPTIHLAGVESDDVVGSLAVQSQAGLLGEDVNTVIFTGDKDIGQLVSGRIVTCDTKDKHGWVGTRRTVREKFGVDPHQIASFLAIQGDKNDGIAGVHGMGAKKARALLEEFDTVEHLLVALAKGKAGDWKSVFTPTVQASLRRDLKLATILTDLNVGKYGPFVMHTPHIGYLSRALDSLAFRTMPPFVKAQLEAAQLATAGSLFGDDSSGLPAPLVEDSSEWEGLLGKLWDDSVKTYDVAKRPAGFP